MNSIYVTLSFSTLVYFMLPVSAFSRENKTCKDTLYFLWMSNTVLILYFFGIKI